MKVKYGTPLCKLKIQLRIPNSSSAVASLAAKIQLYYPCLLQNRLDWYCTSQDQCTVLRPFRRISQQPSSLHSPIWTNMDPYVPMQCNVDQYGPIWTNMEQCGPIWTNMDQCGPICTNAMQCGPIWTNAMQRGPIWTNMECGPQILIATQLQQCKWENLAECNPPGTLQKQMCYIKCNGTELHTLLHTLLHLQLRAQYAQMHQSLNYTSWVRYSQYW